jgi:hypothetical protein
MYNAHVENKKSILAYIFARVSSFRLGLLLRNNHPLSNPCKVLKLIFFAVCDHWMSLINMQGHP